MKIQALLLDLGNVVVRLRTPQFLERIAVLCEPVLTTHELLKRLQSPSSRHDDYERGRLDGREFYAAVRAATGLTLGYEAWLKEWKDYFEPNRPMEALMARARGQVKLWALSNTNAEHLAHLKLNFRAFDLFDGMTASHLVGAAKPETAIYRDAIGRLGVAPDQILYLDDVPAYVEAGRQLGLRAFHYTYNDAELKDELRNLGLELPPLDGRSMLAC